MFAFPEWLFCKLYISTLDFSNQFWLGNCTNPYISIHKKTLQIPHCAWKVYDCFAKAHYAKVHRRDGLFKVLMWIWQITPHIHLIFWVNFYCISRNWLSSWIRKCIDMNNERWVVSCLFTLPCKPLRLCVARVVVHKLL